MLEIHADSYPRAVQIRVGNGNGRALVLDSELRCILSTADEGKYRSWGTFSQGRLPGPVLNPEIYNTPPEQIYPGLLQLV